MPSEQQVEVYRQERTAQEKYVYFLLAAVGAAIALALGQTQGAKLAWSQLPLAGAVALWGLSFFFRCRHIAYVQSTLFANAALLKVEAGEHPDVGRHRQIMAVASEGIRAAIESNQERSCRYGRWQFNCLALGAISYVGWHILEMWLRTVASP